MKTLVVYYSRTGTTEKVAKLISEKLKCDIERIDDFKKRNGAFGYLISGKEASMKQIIRIKPLDHDVKDYDLVVIGTPIWAFTMCSPVRALLSKYEFKKVVFFCTMGGSGDVGTFKDMKKLVGKEPVAVLSLKTDEVVKDNFKDKVDEFISKW